MKNIIILLSILGTLSFNSEDISAMPIFSGEIMPVDGLSDLDAPELNKAAMDFIPFSIWLKYRYTMPKKIKLPPIKSLNVQKFVDEYSYMTKVLVSV